MAEEAGVRWIGPPFGAIRAMGDKASARRLATQLSVPILPGYEGEEQSDSALSTAAEAIGYPLLVKPAAGGGGKGMRVVRSADRLAEALAAARREAKLAFGDDRLILERFLEGPRHVEIQVLFDGHGTGVHLGERDCSTQRRHQKVLEEAPSPAIEDRLRARMGDAALRLAAAVGYRSAGTCEFLVDGRGHFYFLEMNTRLQVEHPVTEFVTGRDLVADQLRIGEGRKLAELGLTQRDLDAQRRRGGHAVEVRVYAEDAENGFLPATGRVDAVQWPDGEGIRVDAGIAVGDEIGPRFDPMLAKVIAHGSDRAEAFDRLRVALDETVILGLVTNLRFLRWLVRQPVILDGAMRIDTLERIWPPDDWAARAEVPEEIWRTAAGILGRTTAHGSKDPFAAGWRMTGPPTIRLVAEGIERSVVVPAIEPADPELPTIRLDDEVHIDVAGRSVAFRIAPPPDVDRAAQQAAAHGTGAATIEAPMPGAVLVVHVEAGTSVTAGAPIVTLEAMKMEHVVAAPIDGRVADLAVRSGEQVARGQPLARIEP
jgi:acetyl-CoA/propionyl-CoA carboxylase, biotin carboxylase, biotin carboxyl carrier protein